MIDLLRLARTVRRSIAKALLWLVREELELALTKRLLLFYDALLARQQISAPRVFYSGDQALLATGS